MKYFITDIEYIKKIKYLLNKKNQKTKIDKKNMDILYNYFKEAYKHTIELRDVVKIYNKQIKFQDSNYFFNNKINHDIKKNLKTQIQYSFILFNKEYNVYICFDKETEEINNMIVNIIVILCIFNKLAVNKNCCKKLDIYIYLSNKKKYIPKENNILLEAEHINSGYSYLCKENNEIIIYRKEEWFKVFIHECLHAFGMHTLKYENLNLINNIFNINPKLHISLCESYVETWARILNVCNSGYKNSRTYNEFNINVKKLLNMESEFSSIQASKILNYMNMYDDYNNADLKYYNESTNVYSYYILTNIFMNNINNFLNICFVNNKNNIMMNDNIYMILIKYIKNHYNNKELLIKLKYNKSFNNLLRMSVIE